MNIVQSGTIGFGRGGTHAHFEGPARIPAHTSSRWGWNTSGSRQASDGNLMLVEPGSTPGIPTRGSRVANAPIHGAMWPAWFIGIRGWQATAHITRRRGGYTLMTVKVASGLGESCASRPRSGVREPDKRVTGEDWRVMRPALALSSGWPSEMLPPRFESGPRYRVGNTRNPAHPTHTAARPALDMGTGRAYQPTMPTQHDAPGAARRAGHGRYAQLGG